MGNAISTKLPVVELRQQLAILLNITHKLIAH